MLEFDDASSWEAQLDAALCPVLPNHALQELKNTPVEYVEDARDLLFDLADREAIIGAALNWLRSETLVGFHGTRLDDQEVASVYRRGLVPLQGSERRDRLDRALRVHPRWSDVEDRLDDVLRSYGEGAREAVREGQVHLTLSRAGLEGAFNHYLTYGSEFDQNVARELLGSDGVELLGSYGKPRLIKIAVPGAQALDAANPYFSVDDVRANGEVPNLVEAFLNAWSFRIAKIGFEPSRLKIDCGMVFRRPVPPQWLVEVETQPNISLNPSGFPAGDPKSEG